MANGKIRFGKQSGGQLALVIPDGVANTEVIVPESGILATEDYVDNNSDIGAITSYSQISGTNTIEGIELTNSIHNVFNDGSAVATYQLNGNANDLGGTYNGTYNGTYEEGKFGQAGKFNGSNTFGTGIVTNPSVVTFSLFVKFNVLTNGQIILSKRSTDGSTYGRGFNLFLANNKIEVEENNGVTGTANIVSNENIVAGEWYHIILERNNALNKLIINKINNSTGAAKIFLEGTSGLNIGGGAAAGLRYYTAIGFNGLIDQVRIFNRALTKSEINTLYTETKVFANAQLNINKGTFIYPKGLGARGYIKSSDVFTGTVDVSTQTDGWKYVAKDENNNFSFYTDKPSIGKKSATLYLKDGKLYKQVDDTPITPISFLSNKVRIASGVAVELAPSDISKTISESLEASSYFGKNAIAAYASIDMTTTPPTILDSYNIASVVRSSNGVGKVTLINPTDIDSVTAICGSNSVAGTVTATTKNEISFATGATNYGKTSVIVIGGKF